MKVAHFYVHLLYTFLMYTLCFSLLHPLVLKKLWCLKFHIFLNYWVTAWGMFSIIHILKFHYLENTIAIYKLLNTLVGIFTLLYIIAIIIVGLMSAVLFAKYINMGLCPITKMNIIFVTWELVISWYVRMPSTLNPMALRLWAYIIYPRALGINVEKDCKFLVEISSRLYKIIKIYEPSIWSSMQLYQPSGKRSTSFFKSAIN